MPSSEIPAKQIAIRKLGADPTATYINGVTVVWTATSPEGGKRVIGWYKNATVFSQRQTHKKPPSRQHSIDGVNDFHIRALAEDAFLLPVHERENKLEVGSKGWPGQTPWWFAPGNKPTEKLLTFLDNISELITTKSARVNADINGNARTGWNTPAPDVERNARVEENAIREVTNWYKTKRKNFPAHEVESVEANNCGWDLEASAPGRTKLLLEVKGRSTSECKIGLSSNEFRVFQDHIAGNKPEYRLCIVTNALSPAPTLTIFRFDRDTNKWINEVNKNNATQNLTIIQSAIIEMKF